MNFIFYFQLFLVESQPGCSVSNGFSQTPHLKLAIIGIRDRTLASSPVAHSEARFGILACRARGSGRGGPSSTMSTLGNEHMYDGSEPASVWPAPVATFPASEEGVELPGSTRCLQQWAQKIEYQGMQKKNLQAEATAYLERMLKASTNAEKRQDSELCSPPDFLRHWREAESKAERRYLALQAVNRHMDKGLCCLPGIAVWLWQLKPEKGLRKTGKRARKRRQRRCWLRPRRQPTAHRLARRQKAQRSGRRRSGLTGVSASKRPRRSRPASQSRR